MADREGRKKGSRLHRSETVTVRLDPRLRYLAELGARKQRRTVSSFIEWAIEHSLRDVVVEERWNEYTKTSYPVTLAHAAADVWDVSEAERFVKLALRFPEFLTHDEQVLWKLLKENGVLWRGEYDTLGQWLWEPKANTLIVQRLHQHWETFKRVVAGEAEASTLPTWQVYDPREDMRRDLEEGDLTDEEAC